MATQIKKFLDYTGLSQFWTIIDTKFANKTDAVKVDSFDFDSNENSVTMTYTDSAAESKTYDIVMPMANVASNQSGFMSVEDKHTIDTINDKINEMAPFHGLQIAGTEINAPGKRGNIGLHFETSGDVEDGTRKAFIELVDLAYPGVDPETGKSSQNWTEVTQTEYEENYANNKAYYSYYSSTDNQTHYCKWSEDNIQGPLNNLNEPLMRQAISRIDVSELVKAGLLQSADVVYRNAQGEDPAGMYLELVFITGADSTTTTTETVYINVTDLVDIYTPGEGINISFENNNDQNGGMTGDDEPRIGTISLKAATDTTLGGVKTGYTVPAEGNPQSYAVKLDNTGNAYVAVPWETVEVNVASEGKNDSGEKYLTITPTETNDTDSFGNNKHSYTFSIEVGQGIKTAEALAGTSVQEVMAAEEGVETKTPNNYITISTTQKTNSNGQQVGKNITIDLTESAKDSLALADSAVQTDKLQEYVESRINELDTYDDPDESKGQKAHLKVNKTTAAYNYVNDTTEGGQAQQFFIQIGQTDGILDQSKCVAHTIGIQDIADFAPLSESDINTICGINTAEA